MADAKGDPRPTGAPDATMTASDSDAPPPRATSASVFDHYEVESEHARGGIGRVLRAWDNRLQRPVAIKELLAANDQLARRFLREIGITARLQHPSIVPVYEAGEAPNGSPFYAMRFVSGRTLRQLIDAAGTLEERMALLPNVLAVADAIAYAHSEGILHRDLKPSNVIIGSFGETVVIDWGLAKLLDEAADPTATATDGGPYRAPSSGDDRTVAGTVLGTPFYMPPEQAAGADVDARADVYALGAMLYHVLVGKPPYAGDSAPTLVDAVLAGAPEPLARVQRNVPSDLVTLVDKAMARAAGDRYPSAKEFAQDLRRYQTGQLVAAHDYSRAALLGRWLTRHRTPVAVAALFSTLLVAGGIASFRQIIAERNRAIAERHIAQSRTNQMTLTQAASALETDPTTALAWLKTYPLDGDNWAEAQRLAAAADARGVARWQLHGQKYGPMRGVANVIAGPGKRELTSVSNDGTARIWDIDDGVERARGAANFNNGTGKVSPDHQWLITAGEVETRLFNCANDTFDGGVRLTDGSIYSIAFSADSAHALLATDHGLLEVDLAKGATRKLALSNTVATMIAVYRDDGRIVAVGQDGKLRIWSAAQALEATWEVPARSPAQKTALLFFDASGRFAATTGVDQSFGILDTTTGAYRPLDGISAGGMGAFLPSGSVAVVNSSQTVVVWDPKTNQTIPLQPHSSKVRILTASDDGDVIASGDSKGEIVVSSLRRNVSVTLSAHKEVLSLAFVGDDLVAGYQDGTIRVWTAPLHLAGRAHFVHNANVFRMAFSPDGRYLASGSNDRAVALMSLADDTFQLLPSRPFLVHDLEFSDDGTRLAGTLDEDVLIWDTRTTQLTQTLHVAAGAYRALFLDVRHLVTAGEDGFIRAWDLDSAQSQALTHHKGRAQALVLDSSHQHAYSGGDDGAVHAWSFATRKDVTWPLGLGAINAALIAPDQSSLMASTEKGAVAVLNLPTGTVRWTAKYERRISSLALSPNGKWLAAGSEDGLVELRDVATGAPGLAFHHAWAPRALAFSRDGQWLASGAYDGVLRVFSMKTGATCSIHALDGHIARVAFSPDSATLALSAQDGSVHLWRTSDFAACVPRAPAAVRAWLARQTNLTISE